MIDLSGLVGTSPDVLNCWDLVRVLYKRHFDLDLPEEPIQMEERGKWNEVELGTERDSDLLLFKTGRGPHVGVCIGAGKMIHSDTSIGVVIERYSRAIWKQRLQAIYRHV